MTQHPSTTAANLEGARQADGKFGTQQHGVDTTVALDAPDSPQWPETFGTPKISVATSTINGPTIIFEGEDGSILEVWNNDGDHVESQMFDGEGPGCDEDELLELATPLFERISSADSRTRQEGSAAFEDANIAEATVTTPADKQLADMVARSEQLIAKAAEQRDKAAASLIARKIRALHPEAESVRFRTVQHDDEVAIVDTAVVCDADGDEVESYDVLDDDGPLGRQVAQMVSTMEANPNQAYWTSFCPEGDDMYEGAYSQINIDAAAGWIPGE